MILAECLIGDILRDGEVVARSVAATLRGSFLGPRISTVFPRGEAELGLAYLLKALERTVVMHIDRCPASIKGIDGDVVDAKVVRDYLT